MKRGKMQGQMRGQVFELNLCCCAKVCTPFNRQMKKDGLSRPFEGGAQVPNSLQITVSNTFRIQWGAQLDGSE